MTATNYHHQTFPPPITGTSPLGPGQTDGAPPYSTSAGYWALIRCNVYRAAKILGGAPSMQVGFWDLDPSPFYLPDGEVDIGRPVPYPHGTMVASVFAGLGVQTATITSTSVDDGGEALESYWPNGQLKFADSGGDPGYYEDAARQGVKILSCSRCSAAILWVNNPGDDPSQWVYANPAGVNVPSGTPVATYGASTQYWVTHLYRAMQYGSVVFMAYGNSGNDVNSLAYQTVANINLSNDTNGSPEAQALLYCAGAIPVASMLPTDQIDVGWPGTSSQASGSSAYSSGALPTVLAPGSWLAPFMFGETSGATPFAAGLAAYMWSANPALTRSQFLSIFWRSCGDSCNPQNRGIQNVLNNNPLWGIPNAGLGATIAQATVPANVGQVFPYVFWTKRGDTSSGLYVPLYGSIDPVMEQPVGVGSGPWQLTDVVPGVSVITKLQGNIEIEVDGYSSDPVTSVELWIGSTRVYMGPPAFLTCPAATYDAGNPQALTIKANTAHATASETYNDVLVTSLGTFTVKPKLTATATSGVLSGSRHMNAPVTVTRA